MTMRSVIRDVEKESWIDLTDDVALIIRSVGGDQSVQKFLLRKTVLIE